MPVAGKPWELYDIEADTTETKNLAHLHPERVREMAARFAEWRKQVGAK